jgi:NAD(P)-dependent dehydrogenase (short-subunit alcohol dehydrogenase family)
MLLKDKTAIIHGGGGAVGGAVAKAFAREGAHVYLTGRTAEKLEKVAKEIRTQGGMADLATLDALNQDALERHLAVVAEEAGPVRIMFNAIDWGDTQSQALVDMTYERFSGAIDTALKTWFLTGTITARRMAAGRSLALRPMWLVLPFLCSAALASRAQLLNTSCASWPWRWDPPTCESAMCARQARRMRLGWRQPSSCGPQKADSALRMSCVKPAPAAPCTTCHGWQKLLMRQCYWLPTTLAA